MSYTRNFMEAKHGHDRKVPLGRGVMRKVPTLPQKKTIRMGIQTTTGTEDQRNISIHNPNLRQRKPTMERKRIPNPKRNRPSTLHETTTTNNKTLLQ